MGRNLVSTSSADCRHSTSVTLVLLATIAQHMSLQIAEARVVEDWPFDKLKRSADLICICKVIAIEEEKNEGFNAEFSRQMRATLQIQSILDNKPRLGILREIPLIHYDAKSAKPGEELKLIGQVNGPTYLKLIVSTEAKNDSKKFEPAVTQYYLMYLRHRKTGGYEPVSGHWDPELSVLKLDRAR